MAQTLKLAALRALYQESSKLLNVLFLTDAYRESVSGAGEGGIREGLKMGCKS